MPNTLGHIGVQVPLSRLLFKKAELQWIATGCLIPDLPWIAQRLLLSVHQLNPYTVAHYTTIQASLLFSTLLAAALSLFSREPSRIFLLLLFNCAIHLLLDACQIKWANGVLLFAPFSWQLTQFNLFWPEHPLSYLISGLGLFIFLFSWKEVISSRHLLHRHLFKRCGRTFTALALIILYLSGPLIFLDQSTIADHRYLTTLQDKTRRLDKPIELDRVPYTSTTGTIKTLAHEDLHLTGRLPTENSLLSIKGKFCTIDSIRATDIHIHSRYRDWMSFLGIFLTLIAWIPVITTKGQNTP